MTPAAGYFPCGEVFPMGRTRQPLFLAGFARHGTCQWYGERALAMNVDERKIILESDFERALDSVLGAFEREGFIVRPVNGGGRFRLVADHKILRCAELAVTLPELTFLGSDSPTLLGCRIAMCELTARSTVVTATSPLVRYPVLSSLLPRIDSRVDCVLHALVGGR